MNHVFGNPRYLRNRPFLVIDAFQRPTAVARTERRDWQKEANSVEMFEHPRMVDGVTPKILAEAAVIIDVVQVRVAKNRHTENGLTEDEIVNHFLEKYRDLVSEGVNRWIKSRAGKRVLPDIAIPAEPNAEVTA